MNVRSILDKQNRSETGRKYGIANYQRLVIGNIGKAVIRNMIYRIQLMKAKSFTQLMHSRRSSILLVLITTLAPHNKHIEAGHGRTGEGVL